jgi:N-acetylglutamate synthase-like GNAT family acetyltransferase
VHPPYRGQGAAGELIRAACDHAARLQIDKLYAATHSAVSTFERAGWLGFDQVMHEGQMLTIFAKRTA